MSAMMSGRAALPAAVRGTVGVRSIRAGKIAPPARAAGNTMMSGGRDQLRKQLRARSLRPTRFARGGVMPVEAKHSAIPEAQVRGFYGDLVGLNIQPPFRKYIFFSRGIY